MASKRKTYFLAPTRDCPSSGPIALGSIIASPHSPELPLTPPLPIDRTLMPVVDTYKDNWRLELEKHKSGKLGLWASFLQIVGVGGDVSVRYDLSDASVYQFKRLVTYTFWPNQEYVKESVMKPEVQAFLRKKRFHQNVYMITGVAVAMGASIGNVALRDRGVHTHFGIDGTAAMLPFSAGPDVDVGWGGRQAEAFAGASDFVFAFRLREMCYSTKKGVVEREFTSGALYGLGEGEKEKEVEKSVGVEEDKFEFLGLAGEDWRGEDEGVDGVEVEGVEGEECECVMLELD